MTPEMLLALAMTMRCHSLIVDIPERRETIAHTVCVKVQPATQEPTTQQVTTSEPVVKKAKPTKKKKRRRRRRR